MFMPVRKYLVFVHLGRIKYTIDLAVLAQTHIVTYLESIGRGIFQDTFYLIHSSLFAKK